MPRGDKTGPTGMGPMTGRAAGYCAGYSESGFTSSAGGRGGKGRGRCNGWGGDGGRGRGGRWGRRNQFHLTGLTGWQRTGMGQQNYPMPTSGPYMPTGIKEQELDILKEQTKYLESSLADIKKMIQKIVSQKEETTE